MATRELTRQIEEALAATGLPWAFRPGSRHRKVVLNGRLVGVLPHNAGDNVGRATKNLLSQIRRVAQGSPLSLTRR